MIVNIDIYQFEQLLKDAANLGATRELTEAGILKPFLSKAEAYRKYSRRLIDRWIRERLIVPVRDGECGAKSRLDRIQLEVLAKSYNRASWFKHNRPDEFHQ